MNIDDLLGHAGSPNMQAFLHAIRLGEGTSDEDGYRRIVGGKLFSAPPWKHPKEFVWIPRHQIHSSAAGAYQFLYGTWSELERIYRFEDFSPWNQDLAAIALIARRAALSDVLDGRIREAVRKCSKEWASLPGSPYGQRTEKLEDVFSEYVKYGGTLAA